MQPVIMAWWIVFTLMAVVGVTWFARFGTAGVVAGKAVDTAIAVVVVVVTAVVVGGLMGFAGADWLVASLLRFRFARCRFPGLDVQRRVPRRRYLRDAYFAGVVSACGSDVYCGHCGGYCYGSVGSRLGLRGGQMRAVGAPCGGTSRCGFI